MRPPVPFDSDYFHDCVVAHGFGAPTSAGLALGRALIAGGDDYATAAFEVVARGKVEDLDHSDNTSGSD